MPRPRDAILLLLIAGAAASPASRALRAQDSAAKPLPSIGPGMTREEVVAHLGPPLAERQEGAHTYYFYDAGCKEQPCVSNDVVIFDYGSVTDALFRSGLRRYTGTPVPATVLPSLIGSKTKPRPTTRTTPITAAATGDTTHRGGIIFVGPRPVGSPVSPYQTIRAPHTDTTRSQPPPPSSSPSPSAAPSPATPPSTPPQ